MFKLCLLFWTCAIVHGSETSEVEKFVKDIIQTWKLRSPTVIVRDVLLDLCIQRDWILCLTDGLDTIELAHHLDLVHRQNKQDGVIFVGSRGHEKLLRELSKVTPSVFSSRYPIFMPADYEKYIQLRLDSNIIFYKESAPGKYDLTDKFSVKGGHPIVEEVGHWDEKNGINFLNSMNRWDRRKDLKGATIVSGVTRNGVWCKINTLDGKYPNATHENEANWVMPGKIPNITGENYQSWVFIEMESSGYFPGKISLIADACNLTVKAMFVLHSSTLLENGSYNWGSAVGALQRKQVDVVGFGLGVNAERTFVFDYPIPTHRGRNTLIAGLPEGLGPDTWVYVRVFGVAQWAIFVVLLILMALALSLESILDRNGSNGEQGEIAEEQRATGGDTRMKYISSGLTLVALYTIQMGDQTVSKHLAPRFLTLTIAMLTLILWIYYNGDITAEMTSGPPDIGIRNFEDVRHGNYKVITSSGFYERILANAKPGTAMHTVYKTNFELYIEWKDVMEEIIKNPQTLFYANALTLIPPPQMPEWKSLTNRAVALEMEDESISLISLGFQFDSEFTDISNYYILKAMEAGLIKNHFRRWHMAIFHNEKYWMPEPGPLRMENVMFTFISLGIGICISLVMAIVERLVEMKGKSTRALEGEGKGEVVRGRRNKADFQEIEITERVREEGKQEERGNM